MVDIDSLIDEAAKVEDQSEVQAGGSGEYPIVPEGVTYGRFTDYIEIGNHPEFYEGKEKPHPVEYVYVGFDLLKGKVETQNADGTTTVVYPGNIRDIEVDGVKRTVCDRLFFKVPKKFTEKAKYRKLFMSMDAGRGEKHLAKHLGQVFQLNIKHNKSADGKKTYVNLWYDGAWHVGLPIIVDALAGTSVNYSDRVRPAISPIRVFLWSHPTKETWDTLFIDGTRKVKREDGTEVEESKNWLQELAMSAKDYKGSPLELMLNKLTDLPGMDNTGVSQKVDASGTGSAAQTSAQTQQTAASSGTQENTADPLAALGLAG